MRIAIQFFGHTRTYQDTYKYLFKNLINVNSSIDFDIFIHTWDESDSTNFGVYKKSKKFMGKKLSNLQIDLITELYKPKALSITQQLPITDDDKLFMQKYNVNDNLFKTLKNISFSIQEVTKLRQNYQAKTNTVYDFVITTRPDILFMKPLNLNDLINQKYRGEWFDKDKTAQFYKETLCEKAYCPYILSDYYGQIMNNNFYICGIDLFNITTLNLANKIGEIHKRLYEFKGIYPEHMITKIVSENNVEINYIGYEKDKCWTILRNNAWYMKSIYAKPLRKIADFVFLLCLYPFLYSSIRFRQMTLFNPHFLEKKFAICLKNFLK